MAETGKTIRDWMPVAITILTLVGWFFTQSYRISALEVRADNTDAAINQGEPKFEQALQDIAVMKNDITYIKQGIDELKKR